MTELCLLTLISAKKCIPNISPSWRWTWSFRSRQALHAIAYQAAASVRWEWLQQQEQPWSLRQEATLYAGASCDTFTQMCHEAFLSSHFLLWYVTPYMAPVQHAELCPNWLPSFVLVQFCFADQILCNFAPISVWLHFCTKVFFCARDCTFLHVVHTEGSMHHSEQVCTGVEGAHFDVQAVHLHCAHVHGIATLMWTILCVFVQMIVHLNWPSICAHVHTMCTSHMFIALRLLCAPLPWWTIC